MTAQLSRSKNADPVIVVGGGLCGAFAALALAESGFSVQLVESRGRPQGSSLRRRASDTGFQRSISITVSSRGMRALDKLGLADGARAIATLATQRVIHPAGEEVWLRPYGEPGVGLWCVPRASIHDLLLNAAIDHPNVTPVFGTKCVDVSIGQPQTAIMVDDAAYGGLKEIEGQAIVACDGVYSGVRQRLVRCPGFSFSQEYSSFGYKDLTASRLPWTDGVHLWPRDKEFIISFPTLQGVMATLFMKHEALKSLAEDGRIDAHLSAVYPDFYEVAGKEAVAQHERRPVGYMVMVETAPWHWEDKVILLGDAAHGVFPFYGQGANAGFEDVIALMNALRGGASSWGDVFREVQEARKGDVDCLRKLSAEHADVLARGLGESDGRRRAELEHALHELDPARFASLYQRVAFSELGYHDAMVNGRKQELLIDLLLKEGDAAAKVRARDSEFIELVDAVGRELGII